MEQASSKFQIGTRIVPNKTSFINKELNPSVTTHFRCNNCKAPIEIKIIPYTSGYPFAQLYSLGFVTRDQVIENGLANAAAKWALHFGDYLVHNLPTLYYIQTCTLCKHKFLVVFGCGESQPGKMMCVISGAWPLLQINETLRD